jgi:hypothetical protein
MGGGEGILWGFVLVILYSTYEFIRDQHKR